MRDHTPREQGSICEQAFWYLSSTTYGRGWDNPKHHNNTTEIVPTVPGTDIKAIRATLTHTTPFKHW